MDTPKTQDVPSYLILISPLNLRELQRDIWIDDPVPAKLKYKFNVYNIGIAYRGDHIRELEKKSYTISFCKPKTFCGSRIIHLNAEYHDTSLIRSKLAFDFFKDIGVLAPEAQHVLLNINNVFKGIYLQIESVDDLFFKKRKLSPKSIHYAINDDANFSLLNPLDLTVKMNLDDGYELIYGSESDNRELCEFIYLINTLSDEDFEAQIGKFINVENYLKWLAGIVCTQNFDGFLHNYALYRSNSTGLYEMIPWDYDATWGHDCDGEIMEHDYVSIEGDNINVLSNRLLSTQHYRNRYKSILEEILAAKFTSQFLSPKIYSLYYLLRPYVLLDPFIKSSIDKFDAEPEFILEFINKRRDFLLKKL